METTTQRPDGSRRVQINTGTVSRVEQTHKKKVNINTIMAKANKTGLIPVKTGAHYGDFTSIEDYQTARNKILDAQQNFQQLPSKIRNRFKNNPGKLITFLNDPNNKQEAIEMGLIERPPKAPTTPEKWPDGATPPLEPPQTPTPGPATTPTPVSGATGQRQG